MRQHQLFITAFCFIVLFSGFVHHPQPAFNDEVFTGRLAIKGPCAQRVVSIVSPNARRAQVETVWRDPMTASVYEYSFTVKNSCDLSAVKEGQTFTFRFSRARVRNACASCLMYRPVPETERFIIILQEGSNAWVPQEISREQER